MDAGPRPPSSPIRRDTPLKPVKRKASHRARKSLSTSTFRRLCQGGRVSLKRQLRAHAKPWSSLRRRTFTRRGSTDGSSEASPVRRWLMGCVRGGRGTGEPRAPPNQPVRGLRGGAPSRRGHERRMHDPRGRVHPVRGRYDDRAASPGWRSRRKRTPRRRARSNGGRGAKATPPISFLSLTSSGLLGDLREELPRASNTSYQRFDGATGGRRHKGASHWRTRWSRCERASMAAYDRDDRGGTSREPPGGHPATDPDEPAIQGATAKPRGHAAPVLSAASSRASSGTRLS